MYAFIESIEQSVGVCLPHEYKRKSNQKQNHKKILSIWMVNYSIKNNF